MVVESRTEQGCQPLVATGSIGASGDGDMVGVQCEELDVVMEICYLLLLSALFPAKVKKWSRPYLTIIDPLFHAAGAISSKTIPFQSKVALSQSRWRRYPRYVVAVQAVAVPQLTGTTGPCQSPRPRSQSNSSLS